METKLVRSGVQLKLFNLNPHIDEIVFQNSVDLQ